MLNLRRLKAIVLLVVVIAAGFVLFEPYFIQEAAADNHQSPACLTALMDCYLANMIANLTCYDIHGNFIPSEECVTRAGEALAACFRAIVICEN